jgi:hypothetical protein
VLEKKNRRQVASKKLASWKTKYKRCTKLMHASLKRLPLNRRRKYKKLSEGGFFAANSNNVNS